MSPASFAHPEWRVALVCLWLAAGLALLAAVRVARRRRQRLGIGVPAAARRLDSDLALWLALGLLALALAGPRIALRVLELPASGVDVVFAVDVSRSMDASDVAPSRLARARRAVEEILARLEASDRFALAVYAGRGVLLTPLTPDRDVLVELLAGLDTALVAPASSRIEAGVRAALSAFEAGSERPRVVLLLGDGEDPERRRDLGSALALRADTRVLAAGFGTAVGSTLDDHGVPLLGESGQPVVSRRDLERLERLASETDGALFEADAWGELDFDAVAAEIRRDAAPTRRADAGAVPGAAAQDSAPAATVARRVRVVPVVPLAAAALVLLLVEGLPRPRGRPHGAAPAGVAVALLALVALPAPAGDAELSTLPALEREARANPGDPQVLVELGIARLERGQRDAAARAFLAAALSSEDAEAASIAYFDLGVAALEQADYAGARAAFLDALALAPEDRRARFNLEWTLEALQQHPAPKQSPEPDADSEPKPPPPPLPESAPDSPPEAGTPAEEPPRLSEEEQRRWLERVRDDPRRALRAAAAASPAERRSGGPAW